jgi:hypothetical protein
MPHADPEERKKYNQARYLKRKADPEKLAAHRAASVATYRRKVATEEGRKHVREKGAAWTAQNREKVKVLRRKHNLKRYYGLTVAEHQALLLGQGGACAICTGDNGERRDLAVDHCHKTQKVRGLLCDRCNQAIGLFKDNPTLLRAAIAYLEGTVRPPILGAV